MEITGAELVARSLKMVQTELRHKQAEIEREVSASVFADMSRRGIGEKSGEIFDLLRKCKRELTVTTRGQELSDEEQNRLLAELFWTQSNQGWGKLTIDECLDIWLGIKNKFEISMTELNAARSRATHVAAIFRPLQEKFYLRWINTVDNFDEENRRKLAAAVLEARLQTDSYLGPWAWDAYKLFLNTAVYNPNQEQKSYAVKNHPLKDHLLNRSEIPFGMIRQSSERIYRQQWMNWIEVNQKALLADNTQADYLSESQYESILREVQSIAAREESSDGLDQAAGRDASIDLLVEVASDPELRANRSWDGNMIPENELKSWFALLGKAWDIKNQPLRATLKISGRKGVSDLTFQIPSLSSATELVLNLLTAYVAT